MSILILILMWNFFCGGSYASCMIPISQATRLRQAPARQARLASTVQCDFAERELASSRTTGLRRSLISAAVASGEVAASEQSVAVGT